MIVSENNISLGSYIPPDAKMDKHLFCKIRLAPKFVLELEDYNPPQINKIYEKGEIHYYRDQKLNDIIDEFQFTPHNISVFTLKQIEFGVGDEIFWKVFERLENKIYSGLVKYFQR